MFDRLKKYFRTILLSILSFILIYIIIFLLLGTSDVVKEKQEIQSYISKGYTVYYEEEPLILEENDLYLLVKDYDYQIDNFHKKIIFKGE